MRDFIGERWDALQRIRQTFAAARKHAGYSLRHVGERLGLSHVAVLKIERGDAPIEMGVFLQLCQIYGLYPADLVGYCDTQAIAGLDIFNRQSAYERFYLELRQKRAGLVSKSGGPGPELLGLLNPEEDQCQPVSPAPSSSAPSAATSTTSGTQTGAGCSTVRRAGGSSKKPTTRPRTSTRR